MSVISGVAFVLAAAASVTPAAAFVAPDATPAPRVIVDVSNWCYGASMRVGGLVLNEFSDQMTVEAVVVKDGVMLSNPWRVLGGDVDGSYRTFPPKGHLVLGARLYSAYQVTFVVREDAVWQRQFSSEVCGPLVDFRPSPRTLPRRPLPYKEWGINSRY